MKTKNYSPSYEDLELLEKCYDKCNTLLVQKDVISISNREFVHSLKKDLQKVIKSLHHKYMGNALKEEES